jgi:putative oxidoreductase
MTSASSHHDLHPDLDAPAHDQRPLIDRLAADSGNVLWLVGRILIGGIFVQSGLAKLMDLGPFAGMLEGGGIPMANMIAPVASAVEFLGGLAVVVGLGTRYAALLLIAFVIMATLIAHRFWDVPPDQQQMQMIHFAKNVAILGGFLFVFVTGGGRFSIDRWRQRPKRINIAS